ncbi:hypothetical protein B5F98_05305 [Pseudoflavonifractor sp. An44]|uniref:DUF4367 domain-containing protein n=1 Tax=Pseudoflavonifractor sp. An44 TaxID=1965635 RepID=UPI000B3809E9|nr:DUF4367 domain-containing protein [Pseudoflavonifractor sp. An44]OUN98038.1 hypothetical protein B5F98_05305 [Pseudoflavonifractor sp. An44]
MRKSRDELARMGSEELKEILRLDSQGVEEYPTEDILYMLDLLGQREEEKGEVHVDVDAAWSRFQRDYLHTEKETQAPGHTPKVRRWQRLPRGLGATAAALVLAFVGMLTARAAGWVGDDPLQGVLDTYGVTQVKAPTWLPRGCQSQTTERIYTLDQVYYQLNTTYEYQGNTMVLEISNADISQAALETVEGTVERTEMYGQTVYILEHSDGVTVTWHSGQVACCLEGPEQEVLVRVAESMLA